MTFSTYPKYKHSGTDWLGEVPAEWDVMPLKWQLLSNDGGVWGGEPTGERDTIVLRSTEQTIDGQWDIVDPATRHLSAREAREAKLEQGDLVVTKSSGSSRHIGKSCLVTSDVSRLHCCFGNFMQRVRTRTTFSPKLAWYYLNNSVARRQLDVLSYSTTGLANLNGTLIGEIWVAVPPRDQQEHIVSFLDHETARIDALIEEQQRLIDLLRQKRDALVYDATLDSDCYESRLSAVVDTVKRPVTIDDEALYEPIGLYNWGRGLFHKEVTLGRDLGDSDFFWLQDGDLIISGQFAWEGAVALASPEDADCVVTHRFPLLRGKSESLDTRFLFAWLTTRHGHFLLEENSRGSAGRNRPLNVQSLLKEKIAVPPLAKQAQVAELVEYERRIAEEARHQKHLLQEHRTSLVSNAVTGKIDVRGRTRSIPSPERVLPKVAEKEGPYG